MRYGANKIAAVLAIFIMLFLSSFYFVDARKKRNEHVTRELVNKSTILLTSKEVETSDKAVYLIVQERQNPGSLIQYLGSIQSDEDRMNLAKKCYERILIYDKHFVMPLKSQLIKIINEDLVRIIQKNTDPDFLLRSLNNYCVLLSYDYYYNNQAEVKEALNENAAIIYTLVKNHLSGNNSFKISSMSEVNMGIQLILTFLHKSQEEIQSLVNLLSPFEGNEAVIQRFNSFGTRPRPSPSRAGSSRDRKRTDPA
jgi:hypothetical protein